MRPRASKGAGWAVVAVAAVVGSALVAASAGAADGQAPKKPVVIKACQQKKPPVAFDHTAHLKVIGQTNDRCTTCHHLVGGKPPAKQRCTACHLQKVSDKLGTCKDVSLTKNPLHVRCIGCHKEMQAEHPRAPTKCAGCHGK